MAKRKEVDISSSLNNILSISETIHKIDSSRGVLNNIFGYEEVDSIKSELCKKAQEEYKQIKNNISKEEIVNLFLTRYK